MKRVRLAAWAALAGLGLLSGCQLSDPCRPSLMDRIRNCCSRPRTSTVTYEQPGCCTGIPVSGMPLTGHLSSGCCDGPILPPSGGSMIGPDYGSSSIPPGAMIGEPIHLPPSGTPSHNGHPMPFPGASTPANNQPPNTLPPPTAINGQPRLVPVPGNGNYAPQTPAPPNNSATRRGF